MSVDAVRTALWGGKPMELEGLALETGDMAPDAKAVDANQQLQSVLSLVPSSIVKIITTVPSLDTGVCSGETHRFEAEVGKLGGQACLITVSMDLPFAQGRFCAGAPKPNTYFLSDHRLADVGVKYGVLFKELRLLSRAVFVVGQDGKLAHAQYVNDTGAHPDYEAVLAAVRKEIDGNKN